jgi:hypothetical protein
VLTGAEKGRYGPIKVRVAASAVHVIAATVLLNGAEALGAAENVILHGVFEQFVVRQLLFEFDATSVFAAVAQVRLFVALAAHAIHAQRAAQRTVGVND